jgi:NTP pyrophosphatase (non-canonical NTP hydrolase)
VSDTRQLVLDEIHIERTAQDDKWGKQNHDDYRYLAILGEEFGEVAQAALHTEFGGKAAGTVRDELVQLAAVAVQWIECIDRREKHQWRDDLTAEP